MARRLPTRQDALRILAEKRSRPARRPPPPLGRSLGPLLRDLDARFGKGAGALMARWREVVGPDIARRAEPVKLTKGRPGAGASLEIRVAGPSASIIQHQAQEILARVNLFLGEQAVSRLRIVQGPLRGGARPPRARRMTSPLDAALEARLAADLERAPDGPLKEALLSLGRGVMRRQG